MGQRGGIQGWLKTFDPPAKVSTGLSCPEPIDGEPNIHRLDRR